MPVSVCFLRFLLICLLYSALISSVLDTYGETERARSCLQPILHACNPHCNVQCSSNVHRPAHLSGRYEYYNSLSCQHVRCTPTQGEAVWFTQRWEHSWWSLDTFTFYFSLNPHQHSYLFLLIFPGYIDLKERRSHVYTQLLSISYTLHELTRYLVIFLTQNTWAHHKKDDVYLTNTSNEKGIL